MGQGEQDGLEPPRAQRRAAARVAGAPPRIAIPEGNLFGGGGAAS
ncbi:hypothetical protein [Micromonospora globbae]